MSNINICGIEYIEFYVGNIFQASNFYRAVFGFNIVAHRTFDGDIKNGVSILLKQNNIHIILTSSLEPECQIADHINTHGDGVKDIALSTSNAIQAFNESVACGARVVMPPTIIEDDNCKIIKATISTFGKTQHSFIERLDESKHFLPNFKLHNTFEKKSKIMLQELDHVAICVAEGTLNEWADFYKNILGFTEFYRENIYTGKSGMNSFVVQNELGNVKFTLLEPIPGAKKSQIKDFLDFYKADGVQHLAFLSEDIIQTVMTLREKGLDFLAIPKSYYATLPGRIGSIGRDISTLEKLQILIDRDKDGLLFQIFTKPVQTRPTFFIEIIQRQGTDGFGSGNIRALFEAMEMEQMQHGH